MTEHNNILSSLQSDALRIATFLATVMVVLRHSFNLHRYYAGGNPWMPITDANIAIQHTLSGITNMAIPAFLFMSGFLFFRDMQKWQDCIPKWQKRIRTLLVPYFLWNLMLITMVLLLYVFPALRPQLLEKYDVKLSSYWLLNKMTLHPIMGHFWYIRTLMIFMLCVPLVFYILKNNALAFIVLFILARCWKPIDTTILSSEGALYFYCGCWIATHGGLPEAMPVSHWIWLFIVPIYSYIMPLILSRSIIIPGGIAVIMYIGWQVCLLLAKVSLLRNWLLSLNQHSFFIYALHGIFISGITLFVSRHISHTPFNSLLAYCFTFVSTLIICLILSIITKKVVPHCYSILSGGR